MLALILCSHKKVYAELKCNQLILLQQTTMNPSFFVLIVALLTFFCFHLHIVCTLYSWRKYYWYPKKTNKILVPYWNYDFFRSSNFTIAKVVALNLFAFICVFVLQIGSWLLTHDMVIALPTFATAIVVALLRS